MAQPVRRQPTSLEIQAAKAWVREHPTDPLPHEGKGPGELRAVPLAILKAVQSCWDVAKGDITLERAMNGGEDLVACHLAKRDPSFIPTKHSIKQSAEKGMTQFLLFQLSKVGSSQERAFYSYKALGLAAKGGHRELFNFLRNSEGRPTGVTIFDAAGQGWL